MVLTRALNKRSIKFFTFSDFVSLHNDENVSDTFKRDIENLKGNEGIIFLLGDDTYQVINNEIKKYKKRGYRIINSSILL
jgi:hypothetical protein